MRTTVLAALLLCATAAARANPIDREKPQKPALVKRANAEHDAVVVSTQTAALLKTLGWKTHTDGSLSRLDAADKSEVPVDVLESAAFLWKDGAIVYDKAFLPVEKDRLGPILRGLAVFAEAAAMDPKNVGAALSGWGLPPSFDGTPLLNPDGSATYDGLMLYQFYVQNPDALKRLSLERLAEALKRFDDAYEQAFTKQAPDVADEEIQLIGKILSAPTRVGEKALGLTPYPDLGSTLAQYEQMIRRDAATALVAGSPDLSSQDAQALAVLQKLGEQKYGADKPIVPAPDADKKADDKNAAATPLSTGLPGLLRALDRINGAPLSSQQQQDLIESFPMGELVWRLGVQNLWRQGLTGKGVKVAVIDGGVAPDAELAGAVKDRQNFTPDRGAALVDDHGTHVAGIIHQLAPDAEIRNYIVFPGDAANPKLAEDNDAAIMAAIRKAVADGNTIINLSLGSQGPPSEPLARLVDQYARKGIMFSVAAGNERGEQSVETPSDAPHALTVGSLNVDGRMSDYSSFGLDFDPRKVCYVIKDVFMMPGQNIRSTLPEDAYGKMSGTSMSTPAMNGFLALVYQQAASYSPAPSAVAVAQRILAALRSSSTPMDVSTLPPDISLAQNFYVVDPVAAYQALKAQKNSVAGK
jgi:subtilisin family serine protease